MVLAAIQGAEGWEDERVSTTQIEAPTRSPYTRNDINEVGVLLREVRLRGAGGLDATPTSTMAPPTPLPAQGRSLSAPERESDDREADTGRAVGDLGERRVEIGGAVSTPSRNGPVHPACGSTWVCFFYGYRDGNGYYPTEQIDAMIQCESSWRVNPPGYHYGLAQFDPGTWWTVSAITGLSDWLDPYQMGYNVAVWASMVSPGTTAGWPTCFHAIEW